MLCADDWLSGECLLGPEDLGVVQLVEEEAGLGEAAGVDCGAGRVVEVGADVGVHAGAGAEAEDAVVAAAAARCAAQCGSEHSGRRHLQA
jgi:hypothetical protein